MAIREEKRVAENGRRKGEGRWSQEEEEVGDGEVENKWGRAGGTR